jgi:hypothetical protein
MDLLLIYRECNRVHMKTNRETSKKIKKGRHIQWPIRGGRLQFFFFDWIRNTKETIQSGRMLSEISPSLSFLSVLSPSFYFLLLLLFYFIFPLFSFHLSSMCVCLVVFFCHVRFLFFFLSPSSFHSLRRASNEQ